MKSMHIRAVTKQVPAPAQETEQGETGAVYIVHIIFVVANFLSLLMNFVNIGKGAASA